MAQHFLLSPAAKTLSVAQVCRMTDAQAEVAFRQLRWPEADGKPSCVYCDHAECYEMRRKSGALRFRCKACARNFSITGGTLFASHKLPLRMYLLAVVIFCNEVKGKSMVALSRDLGVSYKTSFVLAHKLREAMAHEFHGRTVGGADQIVSIDGAYFGGHVKPANEKKNRRDRRFAENRSGKRKVVVIARERDGETVPGVFKSEAAALNFLRARVKRGSEIHADEASHWDGLEARYQLKRINHKEAYSLDGVHTNDAESFFSRMRRGEMGHSHHIAGPYLLRFAQEAAWREDNRRVDNGAQVSRVVTLALASKASPDFTGYWQRHRA